VIFPRIFRISAPHVVAAIIVIACSTALASAPISTAPDQIWKRSMLGTFYAAQERRQLTALCIEVDGAASWLPAEMLRDIRNPDLEKAVFWEGIGFTGIDSRIPNWGEAGISFEVPTEMTVEFDPHDVVVLPPRAE